MKKGRKKAATTKTQPYKEMKTKTSSESEKEKIV
jgi:hypothetical protein